MLIGPDSWIISLSLWSWGNVLCRCSTPCLSIAAICSAQRGRVRVIQIWIIRYPYHIHTVSIRYPYGNPPYNPRFVTKSTVIHTVIHDVYFEKTSKKCHKKDPASNLCDFSASKFIFGDFFSQKQTQF